MWSARARPDRFFFLGLADALFDLVLRVATAAQAPLLLVARRRQHEDEHRVGVHRLHLTGAVDLDLEHGVAPGPRLGHRRAVVVVEKRGPLEEATRRDALFERIAAGEDIRVVGLTGALRTCGPRPAQPEPWITLHQCAHDGALADPTGAGDDEDRRPIGDASR